MASNGPNDGNITRLFGGGVEFGHLINCELTPSTEMRGVTTKASTSQNSEFLPGLKNVTITGECLMAEDASVGAGYSDYFALWNGGTSFTAKYGSSVTGDETYSWTAYVSEIPRQSPNNGENETWSITIQCTGDPTIATNA